MEDILAVSKPPRAGDYPLVCLDETAKQLLADTRVPIRMKPGQPERRDYEYERNGTANLFMMFAPLEGWRRVKVTDRRTAIDYAQALEALSDRYFPNAKKIVLVQDNLNTHKPASLDEAFPPTKQGGSSSGSNGITRQSTAVGLIWRNPNSPFSHHNVSTGASPPSKSSSTKSPHGRPTAMPITPKPTGSSQPRTPASNSSIYTRLFR